jgi:hypothetical protein
MHGEAAASTRARMQAAAEYLGTLCQACQSAPAGGDASPELRIAARRGRYGWRKQRLIECGR